MERVKWIEVRTFMFGVVMKQVRINSTAISHGTSCSLLEFHADCDSGANCPSYTWDELKQLFSSRERDCSSIRGWTGRHSTGPHYRALLGNPEWTVQDESPASSSSGRRN